LERREKVMRKSALGLHPASESDKPPNPKIKGGSYWRRWVEGYKSGYSGVSRVYEKRQPKTNGYLSQKRLSNQITSSAKGLSEFTMRKVRWPIQEATSRAWRIM